jgi:hypothetical protein
VRAEELKSKMIQRGYSGRGVDKEIKEAKRWKRGDVLKKVEPKVREEIVNLVLT